MIIIKSITALAVFALLGALILALPAFAPEATAGEAVALAKGDRLPVQSVSQSCASQVWPNFDASCLRNGDSGASVKQARLVTAQR